MASPAMQPTRPNGWVDIRRPGDYPIILGETLKSGQKSSNSLINIRYNWQPKSGFASRNSRLTESGGGYQLSVKDVDGEEEPYQYSGNSRSQSASRDTSRTPSSLALVFDKSKSAFVLESISTSIDMNLKSGPGHAVKSARAMPQLPSARDAPAESSPTTGNTKSTSTPDDDPGPGDSANPFDFRHFIAEARENLEKTSQQQAGNRTPMSMSGISTPVPPGAGRFVATTPQMPPSRSISTSKTTGTANQKRGPGHSKTSSTATTTKRNPPINSKVKSQERIVDSSSSDSEHETIAVVRRHQTSGKPDPTKTKPSRPSAAAAAATSKSHSRNLSANIGSSPHIIINDDDGDLEIDMGSPPPEDKWKNRRNRINPEMFDRSHTGTPIGGAGRGTGVGSGAGFVAKGSDRDRDVTMKDVSHDKEDDEDDDDEEGGDYEDNDVEEFDLGSPRDTRMSVPRGGDVSRTEDQADDDDELDEEALLAAELEAALDEEDDEFSASAHAGAVGLGIRAPHQQPQQHHQHPIDDDDESEVSEEE